MAGLRANLPSRLHSLLQDDHLNKSGFLEKIEHPSEGLIRAMRVPSRWGATQPAPPRPAPRLGEQGSDILAEARALLTRGRG
jgi:crotonobetainyl-CoA:carnitine CoA-transferase CaiB-like acyl-CoA transferase